MGKFDKKGISVNHKTQVIVLSYGIFMQGAGVDTFNRRGRDFIIWLGKQKKYERYRIVINQSSEPLSNAGWPSVANSYYESYKWASIILKPFDVWFVSDSIGEEFENWIYSEFGWKCLTYHFHFDVSDCLHTYINFPLKQRGTPFVKDIFTCNGNMESKHRALVRDLWNENDFWDKSWWSFGDKSNFGGNFSEIRLDLNGIWNSALPKIEDSFLHLVVETVWDNFYMNGDIRMDFMSKMGRALAHPTPFIAYGNMGLLKHLKELGFQTFDKWWDESYDDIPNYMDRLERIKSLMIELISKTDEEKLKMYNEMIPIFQHNRAQLKKMSYEEKKKINLEIPNFFNKIEGEEIEYEIMDEFRLGNFCVFYEKNLDGGGTTFGLNALSKPEISNRVKEKSDVLDICSGPGFLGYILYKQDKIKNLTLADLNPQVEPYIHKTNKYNNLKNVDFILSDCFDSISTDKKFDIIVSNPPHFKTERPGGYRSDNEKLISLDDNMEFHKKFFKQAANYLKPDGKIILIENCDGVNEDDIRNMVGNQYGVEYVEYDSYGWQGKSSFYTIILYLL